MLTKWYDKYPDHWGKDMDYPEIKPCKFEDQEYSYGHEICTSSQCKVCIDGEWLESRDQESRDF
jgi:hypothetical protein